MSLTCPERSLTALVGPSGSGKTTLTRLVARFWDVSEGSVSIGGVDVRDMRPDELMQQISLVFQDVYLFDGTIEENVLGGGAPARKRPEGGAPPPRTSRALTRWPPVWSRDGTRPWAREAAAFRAESASASLSRALC